MSILGREWVRLRFLGFKRPLRDVRPLVGPSLDTEFKVGEGDEATEFKQRFYGHNCRTCVISLQIDQLDTAKRSENATW